MGPLRQRQGSAALRARPPTPRASGPSAVCASAFAEGVRISRRYLGEMEEVFRREGLPTELTRLPLVESCFDIEAYSKVGAAGIWQFMPSTGRNYMSIGGRRRRAPRSAARDARRARSI